MHLRLDQVKGPRPLKMKFLIAKNKIPDPRNSNKQKAYSLFTMLQVEI